MYVYICELSLKECFNSCSVKCESSEKVCFLQVLTSYYCSEGGSSRSLYLQLKCRQAEQRLVNH